MSFEYLRVYQAAELLDRETAALVRSIPSGHAKLRDQLKRAAASVPYNIAEAFGSLEQGKKLTHLGVARGSADETRAILRKCVRDGLLSPKQPERASNLCRAVAKMLTAMIDKMQ